MAITELPLRGVKILELGNGLAGSFGPTILADFGAEVIKVEHPLKGDILRTLPPFYQGKSLWWVVEGRNKKSITVDISKNQGQKVIRDLVTIVDAVVESFRPGTLEAWGLGYEELKRINPGIILVRVSAFGQDGPYRDRPGYDGVASAMSGLSYLTGYEGGAPLKPGIAAAAYLTGLFNALSVLLALYSLKKTGRGQWVDVAMYEALFRVYENNISLFHKLGLIRERTGNRFLFVAPIDTFATRDGKWIFLGAPIDHIFARLAKAIGMEGLVTDNRFKDNEARCKNAETINAILRDWVKEHSLSEVLNIMEEYEVPAGPIFSIEDIFSDPHYSARGNIIEVEDPEIGKVKMQGISPHFSHTPGKVRWSGPPMGYHNQEIFCDLLNYSQEEMNTLFQAGVVAPFSINETNKRISHEIDKRIGKKEKTFPKGEIESGQPLEGIRILDLGSSGAGPIGTTILGEFGAEVIKIEEPTGKKMLLRNVGPFYKDAGFFWVVEGRGKKSITLNLKSEEGQEIVKRLVRLSDVVLTDFRTGVLEKWNLSYEQLKEINPRIILIRVTTFGETGPYRFKAGYDIVGLGVGGFVYLTGEPDAPPIRPGLILGDYITAVTNALATMIALYYRDLGGAGTGQWVDISLYESIFRLQEYTVVAYDKLGKVRTRTGSHYDSIAPAGHFKTKDECWVAIEAPTNKFFERLARAIGREDLPIDPQYHDPKSRVENAGKLHSLIAEWVGGHCLDEVLEIMVKAGVPISPINNVKDIYTDPHYHARKAIIEVEDPVVGPVKMQGIFPRFSASPQGVIRGAPTLGQHNQEIYTGLLGYSPEEIGTLKTKGVI
jgi:crotonobetainyl-CoA:carnitine CoA-transferase CaiB-like acyl-CoA transferase